MAVVVIFGASFYVTMRLVFTGREVEVPEVIGLPVEEAGGVLGRSDLRLEPTAERYDDRIPQGHVLSQDPPAGATIKMERKVRVTVSLGPLQVSIPDVRGQTLRTAQIALQREGLKVGHVSYTHERAVPPDVVIAQAPLEAGGAAESRGGGEGSQEGRLHAARSFDGRVQLLVSRGPLDPRFVMPDLTSRRMDAAVAFARRAGLRVGPVRRERAPGVARGTVIRQYPQAGYPVGRQEIISLVLSE